MEKMTFLGELIEEMERDAEEYGPLHNADKTFSCGVWREEDCDCPNLKMAKDIARDHMHRVHEWWLSMAKSEAPKNRAEGRKLAAKMDGKSRAPKEKEPPPSEA